MTTSLGSVPGQPLPPMWQNLLGIIDKPLTTFGQVLARQSRWRWGLPLLLFLIAFAIATAVQTPYLLETARAQAESQLATMPKEQAAAAREAMQFTLSLPFLLGTGLGFGGIALVIGMLAQTVYFYFGAMLAGGDDLSFGDMFAVSTWSRIPLAIGLLVQAALTLITRGAIQYPGLAMLVASGDQMADAKNPLVPLLARVDLFWLWHLLLVVLGVAVAAKFGRGKSLALTLLYAALVLALAVAPSFLARAFGG
ncbi:MAG: hypothetical protein FOGNACKC_04154 [Anaerolineae bacterium]|nr:hypothetical protein [Anaerolineae bacterium]